MQAAEQVLSTISDFIQKFGFVRGIFLSFFLASHWFIYNLYSNRVKDAKEQITRLADENKDYRERFLKILDNKFDYQPKFVGPPVVTNQKVRK